MGEGHLAGPKCLQIIQACHQVLSHLTVDNDVCGVMDRWRRKMKRINVAKARVINMSRQGYASSVVSMDSIVQQCGMEAARARFFCLDFTFPAMDQIEIKTKYWMAVSSQCYRKVVPQQLSFIDSLSPSTPSIRNLNSMAKIRVD